MIARLSVILERWLVSLARWLATRRGEELLAPRYVPHVLTDVELERIAERALDRAMTAELYAPEIVVWRSGPGSSGPAPCGCTFTSTTIDHKRRFHMTNNPTKAGVTPSTDGCPKLPLHRAPIARHPARSDATEEGNLRDQNATVPTSG